MDLAEFAGLSDGLDKDYCICEENAKRRGPNTCILPVKLMPRKTYATWFNFWKFNSFREINNNLSMPCLLVCQTQSK